MSDVFNILAPVLVLGMIGYVATRLRFFKRLIAMVYPVRL